MPLLAPLAAFLWLTLSGCTGAVVPPAEPVSITDLDGIEAALAQRRGSACLVNFWATWCPPCVAELPELMAVAHEFEASGARVLGISFDLMYKGSEPEPTLRKVRDFLARQDLALEALICEQSELRRLVEHFQLPDAIPVTYAYDTQGTLVDQHVGQATRERFAEMMRKALGR